jgi:hypothetical protein
MLTSNQPSYDISGFHGRIKLQKHDPSNSKLEINPGQSNPMIQNIIKKSSNSLLLQKSNKTSESILSMNLKSKHSFTQNSSLNPASNYGSRTYMKNWMEIERDQVFTYEYLCHVTEAKQYVYYNYNCKYSLLILYN